MAASSYWRTNKMCWIWKTSPTPIQFRFLLLLWFHHFFLPLPWFSRGHAGVRMLFSYLSGKMMSLNQTSLHSGIAPSSRPTACAAEKQAWHAERTHLFHDAFQSSKIYWWKAGKNILHTERGGVPFCLLLCSPFLKNISPAFRQLSGCGLTWW